jgi:hypothetical protein
MIRARGTRCLRVAKLASGNAGGTIATIVFGEADTRPPVATALLSNETREKVSACQTTTSVELCAAFPQERILGYGLRNHQNRWTTVSNR